MIATKLKLLGILLLQKLVLWHCSNHVTYLYVVNPKFTVDYFVYMLIKRLGPMIKTCPLLILLITNQIPPLATWIVIHH